MSLDNLPDITFCETSTEKVESSVLTVYEKLAETSLFPGDPVRLFLESLASVIAQQRQIIDYTGKQNLLAFSQGDFLDHLGAFTNTERLKAKPALTTIRFETNEIHGYVVPIVKGTKISPDNKLWFETSDYTEILTGDIFVEVSAFCLEKGQIGNGFAVGQIDKLESDLSDISSASNVTISSAGAEIESNRSFAERIHTAPESFSVAGPQLAYAHWAKSSHQDISDVAVFRSSPLDLLTEDQLDSVCVVANIESSGLSIDEKRLSVARWLSPSTVNVVPLCIDGVMPTADILSKVDTDLQDNAIRPLTDEVVVSSPSANTYEIFGTYFISSKNKLLVAELKQKIEKALAAYVAWQKAALGRDVNPSKLISMLVNAGASRVDVVSPVFSAISRDEVAIVGSSALVYGGLDE
ncbi:MAG: baseplate J/gp47 family protein [Desulfotalea sp.]